MAELHIGDLLLLKVDRGAGCSIASLARRQQAVLADLTRLLPRLATLQVGDLDARVVPDVHGYRLRLLLQPRQRSLLVDPENCKPKLEDEAELLRGDIQKVGLRVLRAARDAKGTRTRLPSGEVDCMHELLVRRARQQWRFVVEHLQIELPFPDCPRFFEDEAAHRIEGIVHAVTERVVILRCAEVWTLGPSPRLIARMGRLCIELAALGTTSRTNDHHPLTEVKCGHPRSQVARLKRCTSTSAVIGAIEVPGPP